MKKVFYHLFFLLALAGCTKETGTAIYDSPSDKAGFKFELTTANSTRAITDDNFKTVFTEGDQVGLFVVSRTSDAAGELTPSGNSVDNRKLTYSGGMWIIDKEVSYPSEGEKLDFYAYYPYMENVDPTNIAYNAAESMFDLMMARTGGIDDTYETVTLVFSHLLSLVDAQVTGGAAKSAVIKGISTTAAFNLGKFGSEDVMTLNSEESAEITMEKYDKMHFRAYIPSQDASGSGIEIRSGSSTQPYSLKNSSFIKGTAYQYNIVSNILNLADLPNCYIVKPGESVTFPVLKAYEVWRKITFINNGNLRKEGELGVELIWQDTKDLISELTLNLNEENPDQSTITVKANAGISGNAHISATMGGDKVWSWHIWVTDFNPNENTGEVDNNGDGTPDYIFMDRNLGALTSDVSDPLSVGMYYQGGKNIPYAGFTDKFPTDGAAITTVPLYDINNGNISYNTGDVWGGNNQGQAMRRVLTDPHLFVTATGEPYSWITTEGSTSLTYGPNFWTEEETGEKGVFDPCPEGWMVPAHKNGKSPWTSLTSASALATYPKSGRMKFNGTFGDCGLVMLYSGTMTGLKNCALAAGDGGYIQTDNYHNYSTANALNVRCIKVQ